VDDQRLHAAAKADGDWITFGRDYSNQRFAPLRAIDRSNVARLTPTWVYQLGTVGSTQTHPLVVGGVMYVTMPGNDVAAIDAATGDGSCVDRPLGATHLGRDPLSMMPERAASSPEGAFR
jgi:glucose dehydrogenase